MTNTSDGGFLAVGHTKERPLLKYNPTAPGVGTSLSCWPEPGPIANPDSLRSRPLIFAVKYDHNGTEQWKYAYGEMDNPNDHLPLGALQFQPRADVPWDVIERADGGFRLVACAVDPDIGMNPRAFVADLASNGVLQDRQAYGEGDPNDPSTWKRSMLMGIARWGNDYVAVGGQYSDQFEEGFADVLVIKLGPTLAALPVAVTTLSSSSTEHDMGFDVAFAGDGSVHVASVLNCDSGLPAPPPGQPDLRGCRHAYPGTAGGDLIVHRLSRSNLSLLGSTGSGLGTVKAFDLLVGLTSTSDGGTALVSTKQPNGPTGQGGSGDNTDAFVAKLGTTANVLWTTTYDARTSRIHTETGSTYEKHQECLYDIAETADGGLIISGNNSSNLDDYYVVRFGSDAPKTLPGATIANSHLVYPTAALPNNQHYVATLTGSLTVAASGEVWVDPRRTLKLPQGSGITVYGDMQADNATLTQSVTGQRWAGILVGGTLTVEDGSVVEHATTGIKVYHPGAATVTNSALRYNTTGLDVLSDGGTTLSGSSVTQNGNGVRSGALYGLGGPTFCTGCRSAFTITDSDVSDNSDYGVYAIDANVEIRETTMSDNALSGLVAGNATVFPFHDNFIEQNGVLRNDDGIYVLAGGDVQMASDDPDPYGVNRVADNGYREVALAPGASAFIGTYNLNGIPSNDGRNSIYDTSGGTLIANNSGSVLQAGNTYWASFGAPPSGAFSGNSLVKWQPVSNCDYTVSPPSCLGARGEGSGLASLSGKAAGGTAQGSGARGNGDLGDEIRAVRAALASNPTAAEAPGLVYTLASLHRHDPGDATGERAASWGLLRSLRARINHGNGVPAALRPVAEAALEAEAVEELALGNADAARSLAALRAQTESGRVGRVLGLVEAHLEAHEGNYADAAALVEAAASEAATEGDPEEDPEGAYARSLYDLAALFSERAEETGSARDAGSVASKGGGAERAVLDGAAVLSVYPNPFTHHAAVTLQQTESADVSVVVFDVLGRRVAVLHEGVLEAGRHTFALDGAGLPSGTYLVRAESDGGSTTERITLVR